jgi:hypothetical protein
MKADFDSQANALLIDLIGVGRCDDAVEIDDTYCHAALWQGQVATIELLDPADHLDLLERAGERLDLDSKALIATAKAALAAPDRAVTVSDRLAA